MGQKTGDRGGVETTMKSVPAMGEAARNSLMDRNVCPAFSKPHDMGPNTIPEVFFQGTDNRGVEYGKPKMASLNTTMNDGGEK